MDKFTLEICVDSPESIIAASVGGCTRLELCSNLVIGGTTPSAALFEFAKKNTVPPGLPVNVLIRPRYGDFCYSAYEYKLILQDVKEFLELGADGIVCGFLNPEGSLDSERLNEIIELTHSYGKSFTLHRAFDMTADPIEALELCKNLGVDTILTSGQRNNCLEGMELITALDILAGKGNGTGKRVDIMVGAGVNAQVIKKYASETNIRSYHMSAKEIVRSKMAFKNENVSMGIRGMDEYEIYRTNSEEVAAARAVLEGLNDT